MLLDEELPGYLEEERPPVSPSVMRSPPRLARPLDPSEFQASLPPEPLGLRRLALGMGFLRAVDVPFDVAEPALAAWWAQAAGQVGHSRLTEQPRFDAATGQHSAVVLLGWSRRPMVLGWFPWLGGLGTMLTLTPRHGAHPRRRYFAAGHVVLDAAVAGLRGYAPPVC